MPRRRFGYEEFGVGFFVGLAVGAVVAILAAPRSGTETRERITDLVEIAKDQLGDVIDKSRSVYDAVLERLDIALNSDENTFQRKLDEIKEELGRIKTPDVGGAGNAS